MDLCYLLTSGMGDNAATVVQHHDEQPTQQLIIQSNQSPGQNLTCSYCWKAVKDSEFGNLRCSEVFLKCCLLISNLADTQIAHTEECETESCLTCLACQTLCDRNYPSCIPCILKNLTWEYNQRAHPMNRFVEIAEEMAKVFCSKLFWDCTK